MSQAIYAEGSAKIYVPQTVDAAAKTGLKQAFVNPVQEYNRDLSIVAIRAWSEVFAREKLDKRKSNANKKRKLTHASEVAVDGPQQENLYRFTLFEALAATGLRSIRYAKEIPLLKSVIQSQSVAEGGVCIDRKVIANDLSESAVKSMKENLALNGLDVNGKDNIQCNEGDCCTVMYEHRSKNKFDCIDLDPYGTAAPFVDAAIQAIQEGGLLCVTCTDGGVLAGSNYPEKALANYGGLSVRAEFSHEVGIRLILNLLSSTAARYGKYIKPLLSLSIDFYFRIFVRVYTGAKEVKSNLVNTGTVYICSHCQNTVIQPFGKRKEVGNNVNFRNASGQAHVDRCEFCQSSMQVGGPLWLGPLHDVPFIDDMLGQVDKEEVQYKTKPRIRGMATLAKHELHDPFCFTPSKISGSFHSTTIPLADFANALLNLGYKVSRSHTLSGSIKTDAPRSILLDVQRKWIETHPVNRNNIPEHSPANRLIDAVQSSDQEISFAPHADLANVLMSNIKLVKYQANPEPNFGPQSKAAGGKERKPKRKIDQVLETTGDSTEPVPSVVELDGGFDINAKMEV